MKSERGLRCWILCAVLLLGSAASQARCLISVQGVRFGGYDESQLVATVTSADITIDCRSPILVTVNIGPSMTSGTISNREMRHSSRNDRLAYNLFQDAAMHTVWGDGTQAGGNVVRVEGVVVQRVYAQIFPRQDVWVGDYSDSVTVTVLP